MTTEEKFAFLTPEGKAIVNQKIERLLIEQSNEEKAKQTEQFIQLLGRADTATREWIEKCLILFGESSGFNAAFEEATPPGEVHPPAEVMRNLVNEWAEREGLN